MLIEGYYISNKKYKDWLVYNDVEYDTIAGHYRGDLRVNIWSYYKAGKLIKNEYYGNGYLEHYYISEFDNDREIRLYFKDGKKYATAIYIGGTLMEYTEFQ